MLMRCCLQVDAVRMPRSAENPHGNGFTAEVRSRDHALHGMVPAAHVCSSSIARHMSCIAIAYACNTAALQMCSRDHTVQYCGCTMVEAGVTHSVQPSATVLIALLDLIHVA
jgi:hypothetical protein